MLPKKCPTCGLFCKQGQVVVNGFEEVIMFTGLCAKCGEVDLMKTDWSYEEIVGEDKDE